MHDVVEFQGILLLAFTLKDLKVQRVILHCTTHPVKTTPHQEEQQGVITVAHCLSEHSSTHNHAECRIQIGCKKELRSG